MEKALRILDSTLAPLFYAGKLLRFDRSNVWFPRLIFRILEKFEYHKIILSLPFGFGRDGAEMKRKKTADYRQTKCFSSIFSIFHTI